MRLGPAAAPRIFEHRDSLVLLGSDGIARRLDGDSAALARAVLDFVTRPRDRDEILAHLASLTGASLDDTAVVDELLALLRQVGALVEVGTPAAASTARPPSARRRVVLGLTGAVATALAPDLVLRLQARGFEVRVALTRAARRFVRRRALEALTHAPVADGFWPREAASAAPHIQLAEWAELVLVCPASATTLSRIAHGDCSDLVAAIAIATRAPVALVPSMNAAMLGAPSVARNLEQLLEDGFHVVRGGAGLEVAHAPGERAPVAGVAASFAAVVDLACLLVGSAPLTAAPSVPSPSTGARWDWERIYAETPVAELAWYTEAPDPDLVTALERLGLAGGRALDVGTGPGTVAIALARRGFAVTAIDVAPSAVAHARVRASSLPIDWRIGDILTTELDGTFDLIHDRGCLHTLPPERLADYAARLARLAAPGAHLLLKTHARPAPHPDCTLAFSPAEIAALFGDAFDLVAAEESLFHGPSERTPLALSCVLRRRAG